ncbi:MAG: glycoside hydrolase family 88 protein [Clostridia bacterium]|nr:glycoside hydrolase family 88 protein [Clostridia bacterium]
MDNTTQTTMIKEKLDCLLKAFVPILYEDDEVFLAGMKERNLAGDDIRRYQHWEWPQGVGLYGLWQLFESSHDVHYLEILTKFFDKQMTVGFPALNVNTIAPFLAMSYVGEYLKSEKYLAPCRDAAQWIMEKFPRTEEGGFQHMTSDTLNDQELWDDTLFMTVLFLANMGRIEEKQAYIQEAEYQFLLHAKYLADPKTGLWYHGWTFKGRHNFAKAFWGRGNCWITIAIPTFLQMVKVTPETQEKLMQLLRAQADSLLKYQSESGMWHTLIDDPTSYEEASATCGFAYGILKAVHTGLMGKSYAVAAEKALPPMLSYIDDDGTVHQVSYGTPMGRETKDFYKQIELKPMPYGQALAMLFLSECLTEEHPLQP